MGDTETDKARAAERHRVAHLQAGPDDPKGHKNLANLFDLPVETVKFGLTRGFSSIHWPKISAGLAKLGILAEENVWSNKKVTRTSSVRTFNSADEAAHNLLGGEPREFLCIRSPRRTPRTATNGIIYDNDDLADFSALSPSSPSKSFMQNVWNRALAGHLKGSVYWAIGRIGAIPEIWASASILMEEGIKNVSIHIMEHENFVKAEKADYFPIMGARVIDRRSCLLSYALKNDPSGSDEFSIIEDRNLASTLYKYADHLHDFIEDGFNESSPIAVKKVLSQEYARLKEEGEETACFYGDLDDFRKVEEIKNRIVDAFKSKCWFPPLA